VKLLRNRVEDTVAVGSKNETNPKPTAQSEDNPKLTIEVDLKFVVKREDSDDVQPLAGKVRGDANVRMEREADLDIIVKGEGVPNPTSEADLGEEDSDDVKPIPANSKADLEEHPGDMKPLPERTNGKLANPAWWKCLGCLRV